MHSKNLKERTLQSRVTNNLLDASFGKIVHPDGYIVDTGQIGARDYIDLDGKNVNARPLLDEVRNPGYYKGIHGLEVREVQENFVPKYEKYGAMVASDIKDSIKYALRAPEKENVIKDLKKSINMLEYAIKGIENGDR